MRDVSFQEWSAQLFCELLVTVPLVPEVHRLVHFVMSKKNYKFFVEELVMPKIMTQYLVDTVSDEDDDESDIKSEM